MSKEVDNIFGKIALILVFGSALLHGWLSVLQYMVHQEDILLPVDCILFCRGGRGGHTLHPDLKKAGEDSYRPRHDRLPAGGTSDFLCAGVSLF